MPITKSAKKALRQNKKKRIGNIKKKKAFRNIIKNIRELISENKKKEAEKLLPKAYKAIDKAVKAGILKKNTASRKKSRLTKFINRNKSSSVGNKSKDLPQTTPKQS